MGTSECSHKECIGGVDDVLAPEEDAHPPGRWLNVRQREGERSEGDNAHDGGLDSVNGEETSLRRAAEGGDGGWRDMSASRRRPGPERPGDGGKGREPGGGVRWLWAEAALDARI